jgi:hypothetical protein
MHPLLIKEGEPLTGPLVFEERPIRYLEILKLRGADLIFPRPICTIHNGLKVMPCREIPRLKKLIQHVAPETWLPPDQPRAYTTGISDLDREIGGYPQGSTILFEINPKFTPWEYNVIIAPAIASFVLRADII